jgi:quercetin dioxygenase-like cupin family protein
MERTASGIKHVGTAAGQAYWEMGASLVVFKATSADTGGHYSLFEVSDEPQTGPPFHQHRREDEAYFILEGTYEVHYPGGTPLRLAPGDYTLVPRGTVHTYKCVGGERGRMLVTASPGGLEGFFAELGTAATDREHPPAPQGPPDFGWMVGVAAKYEIEVTAPPP